MNLPEVGGPSDDGQKEQSLHGLDLRKGDLGLSRTLPEQASFAIKGMRRPSTTMAKPTRTSLDQSGGDFYEFFAGGGMARAGLGPSWTCVFANDFDEKKAATYESNWGEGDFKSGDVGVLSTEDLPGRADLVWASFPCQDLSLAGKGAGLKGAHSGTFWPFWRLMKQLRTERRPPRIIAIENVCGTLTSNGRKDFAALVKALADSNYHFGALVIDAVHFLPQSRPRLFIVAVDEDARVPEHLMRPEPDATWSPDSLIEAHGRLTKDQRSRWVWWALPAPPARKTGLSKLIEKDPKGVAWHTKAETKRLLDLMSPLNRKEFVEVAAGLV